MVKQLVSDREKQELLVLIKTEFKNNQQVWGNKFWQRLEGKGAYTEKRSWGTLRNTAKKLSGSQAWNEAFKGLDVPLFGKSNLQKVKQSVSPGWNRAEGTRILKEMIAFEGTLKLTEDTFWEEIKTKADLNKNAVEIRVHFFQVLSKNLSKHDLATEELKLLKDRLVNSGPDAGGLLEIDLCEDSDMDCDDETEGDSSQNISQVDAKETKASEFNRFETGKDSPMKELPKPVERSSAGLSKAIIVVERKEAKGDIQDSKADKGLLPCNPTTTPTFNIGHVIEAIKVDPKLGTAETDREDSKWQKNEDDAVSILMRLREAEKLFNNKELTKSLKRTTIVINGLGRALKCLLEHKHKLFMPVYDEDETVNFIKAICRNQHHVDSEIKMICAGAMKVLSLGRSNMWLVGKSEFGKKPD